VPEALGNRPSAEQLLILHAALGEPDAALGSWRRWRAEHPLEGADPATARLLPLVYRNLGGGRLGADSSHLRDLYRRSWQHNQVLFKRAGGLIGRLERAGIETLVLKGASLAGLSYGDAGSRPMDDVDVLVPVARAEEAFGVIAAAGWRPNHERPAERLQAHHSLGYSRLGDGEVDLHWFSLWQPASDRRLWEASVPFELAGAPTRAPCAADQLLLACVHGAPWSRLPPFRWIADAVTVIRRGGPAFEWDRVVAEAKRRQLTVATGAALAYLREELGAAVPERVLSHLESAPAPRHERAAFRASCRPDSPTRTLRMAWDRYRRLRDLDTGAVPPPGFLSFARRFWDLDSAWRLPLHAARALKPR
jgi:hypothetical protein